MSTPIVELLLPVKWHLLYVNPQMVANTLWERGVTEWNFLSLPPRFHTESPHVEMGTLAVH